MLNIFPSQRLLKLDGFLTNGCGDPPIWRRKKPRQRGEQVVSFVGRGGSPIPFVPKGGLYNEGIPRLAVDQAKIAVFVVTTFS